MEKISQNLFELATLCFMLRSFVVGPNISDALILISLIISIVYTKNYLNRNKLDLEKATYEDIKMIKNELSMLKLDRGLKKVAYGSNTQGELRF